MNNPLITVVVPCFNHEKYIIECLESIQNQTFKDFQWIVIDDGSRDSCPDILKKARSHYNYELYLQMNKGLAITLTETIKYYARGKYICICASDDFWVPRKLEIQLEFMQKNLEYPMSFGKTYYVDANSKILEIDNNPYLRGGQIFEDILLQKFHPPVNYMYTKKVLEEFGYFKPNIIGEDFYMNCLISSKYPIGFINDFLSFYRIASIETKRDPYLSLLCRRNTIDLFKKNPLYKKAVLISNYKSGKMLVLYKKYKILSLGFFFQSILCYNFKDILRYIYYLFCYWK